MNFHRADDRVKWSLFQIEFIPNVDSVVKNLLNSLWRSFVLPAEHGRSRSEERHKERAEEEAREKRAQERERGKAVSKRNWIFCVFLLVARRVVLSHSCMRLWLRLSPGNDTETLLYLCT